MSEAYDNDNIFAKILRKEIPCDKIYENEHTLVFKDISPQLKIHILFIPKGAYISAQDFHAHATAEEIVSFYQSVSKVATQLDLPQAGYRLISNHGEHSCQAVPHYHLHLLAGEKMTEKIV